MLKISKSISNLDDSDIADNLLYYDYNVKHLISLKKRGVDEEDNAYISAYRSFEGEVFENFIYEKLVRYASEHEKITEFILKGPHRKRSKALPNALSVNWKGQIVYRTKRNEIGEFDGLIFAEKTLYFVEMTLVKSVSNLKKRLRKKKALLEVIYPDFDVKALLILNEGATGVNQLPDYCTVWLTKPYSAHKVYHWMTSPAAKRRRKKFARVSGRNLVHADRIKTTFFRYYDTLTWIMKKLRGHRQHVIDMRFMGNEKFIRYHDLFTKVYLGFIEPDTFRKLAPDLKFPDNVTILVALEKEHTGRVVVVYFMQHARKKVDYITINDGVVSVSRKDPFGVTVTEVVHIIKTMHPSHKLEVKEIKKVESLLEKYEA